MHPVDRIQSLDSKRLFYSSLKRLNKFWGKLKIGTKILLLIAFIITLISIALTAFGVWPEEKYNY
jgi:hypothetical protein